MRIAAALTLVFVLVVSGAIVVSGPHAGSSVAVTPAEALAACAGANPSYQTCQARGATTLEIALAPPEAGYTFDYQPNGQGWIEPGDQIVIPPGYCYRPISIVVHVQTSSTLGGRNEKIVLRDPTDPDPPGTGNRGRSMGPGPQGIAASSYVDVVYGPGSTQGVAPAGKTNYGTTGWLPDWCITADYTIGVDFAGEKSGDQFSEFFALVEWQQA